VIRGDKAERHFYCGGCDHAWAVDDTGVVKNNYGRPPERSRSSGA
jgi:hypothetical protein